MFRPKQRSQWTTDTLKEHYDALRVADQRALQIKEEADVRALELAREIQTYKDEKANELRSQIESERGLYATKDDVIAAIEKVEAGRGVRALSTREWITAAAGVALILVYIIHP